MNLSPVPPLPHRVSVGYSKDPAREDLVSSILSHHPKSGTRVQIARIALPLPVDQLYSYRVPDHFSRWIRPGRRVVVPFGRRKLAGVVVEEGREADLANVRARDILDVDVELPPLSDELLELTRWIATYYMCSWGEAIRAALPPGSAAATTHSTTTPSRIASRAKASP